MNFRRDVFQAIADPTRRGILTMLALQAMTPGAIASGFGSSRQTISKHIQILTECELLNQKQVGREIYYELNPQKIKEIDVWVNQLRQIWETRFHQLNDVLSTIKK
ncbi:ArsR/SmtB family transcription factor [Flavobacterium sp. 3HN19-14]|uniref:ArsR/SmtB family transcription factor n=1 Tax=Flavobacterium sp. 3HN19-14 TaxID=3448133 RepID=UPI003EDFFDE3